MKNDYELNLIWGCYRRHQMDEAIRRLKGLLAEDPTIAEYHGLLAACLLQQSRLYAAEYELKIALGLDSQSPFLFLIYARVHFLSNRPQLALQCCDEALSLSPEYIEALLLKSSAYRFIGKRFEALSAIESAARIEPNSVDVMLEFAEYYHHIGDNRQALIHASEVLSVASEGEAVHALMAEIQLALGNIAEADYHAKYAMTLNPNSERALQIFCDLKMRKNILMGLWWRFNSLMAGLSQLRQTAVLIIAFIFFNLLSRILFDCGYVQTSALVSYFWLAVVIYSWIGLPVYLRALRAELKQFRFDRDF